MLTNNLFTCLAPQHLAMLKIRLMFCSGAEVNLPPGLGLNVSFLLHLSKGRRKPQL